MCHFVAAASLTLCARRYGLLIQDKWKGNLLDLLFKQKEYDLEAVYQLSHRLAIRMLTELHQAGICYGAPRVSFKNVLYCDSPKCQDVMKTNHGFHLGLQDWRMATPRTSEGMEQDMAAMNTLFMEISHAIQTMRRRERVLPPHIPHDMRVAIQKMREL